MTKILVVGGGLTSAVTASLLSKSGHIASNLELVVWDKARGCGGRMSTSRMPSKPNCTADLGAQYITAIPDYARKHSHFYFDMNQCVKRKKKLNFLREFYLLDKSRQSAFQIYSKKLNKLLYFLRND